MGTQKPYLNDMFATARREPPVVSEGEINALLDQVDLHGQQALGAEEKNSNQRLRRGRNTIMGSIAILIISGFIGAGMFLMNPESSTETTANIQPQLSKPTAQQLAPSAGLPIEGTEGIAESRTIAGRDLAIPTKKNEKVSIAGRDDDPKEGQEEGNGEVEQKLTEELQKMIESYWVDKINGYKRTIDRMIAPTDRAELDRLRVRWGLTEKEESSGLNYGMSLGMQSGNANNSNMAIGVNIDKNGGKPTTTILQSTDEVKLDKSDLLNKEVDVLNQNETSRTAKIFIQNGGGDVDLNMIDVNGEGLSNKNTRIIQIEKDIDIDEIANDGTGEKQIIIVRDGEGDTITFSDAVDLDAMDLDDDLREIIQKAQANVDGAKSVAMSVSVDGDIFKVRDGEPITVTADEFNLTMENETDKDGDTKQVVRKLRLTNSGPDVDGLLENSGSMVGFIKNMIRADKSESSQILSSTWDIADRNRVELDALKGQIKADMKEFAEAMEQEIANYAETHRSELSAEAYASLTEKSEHAGTLFESDEFVQSIEPLYNVVFEPMILLYNGSDINPVLTSTIAEPVAGISLDANSTLKQSYPNPASDKVTIAFTLPEGSQSSETTLRLFNAKGSEVQRLDLGSVGTGDHTAQLDISNLPAGTYLYHLTVQTANGEQVFSKKMDVVK
ncbi:MAG: T9SS type A sorting domain-containing protein [Candidatus Kapaibacterium sp.]